MKAKKYRICEAICFHIKMQIIITYIFPYKFCGTYFVAYKLHYIQNYCDKISAYRLSAQSYVSCFFSHSFSHTAIIYIMKKKSMLFLAVGTSVKLTIVQACVSIYLSIHRVGFKLCLQNATWISLKSHEVLSVFPVFTF